MMLSTPKMIIIMKMIIIIKIVIRNSVYNNKKNEKKGK